MAVLCLIGDITLADKWLTQFSRSIRFDFQLYNFCECIEQVKHVSAVRSRPGKRERSAGKEEGMGEGGKNRGAGRLFGGWRCFLEHGLKEARRRRPNMRITSSKCLQVDRDSINGMEGRKEGVGKE